jgi:hypothetical protein
VNAPTTSLSYWRTEAYLPMPTARPPDSVQWMSAAASATVSGARATRDDLADNRRLLDYAWVRTAGHQRWLLGHQQVNAHPLLGSLEITGAQMAWTNRPDLLYGNRLEEGELVSGRTAPASTIIGSGPIGGVAELRFDGIVVDRVPVALDGRYEFRDIPLSRGTSTRVEVALYETAGSACRCGSRTTRARPATSCCRKARCCITLGVGENGNPLDREFRRGSAGFYEARFGVLPGLTLDFTTQHLDGRDYWLGRRRVRPRRRRRVHGARRRQRRRACLAGRRRRLSRQGVVAAASARRGCRLSPGLDQAPSGSLYERYAETGWRGERWSLSLLGRDYDTGGERGRVRYLKPGIDWYPTAGCTSLRDRT